MNIPLGVSPASNIAFFNGFTFVVFFLTTAESDYKLNVTTAAEQFDGNDGKTGDFLLGKGVDLFFGGQEFDVAGGIGAKSEVVEPKFVVANGYERTFKLDVVIADATDFVAVQNHADRELVAELIVEASLAVDRGHVWRFLFLHKIIILQTEKSIL